MTLLAWALGDDHVVIGSDAALLHVGPRPPPGFAPHHIERVNKLQQVRDLPLAWGLCGSANDLKRFRDWIDGARVDSWEELGEKAAKQVRSLRSQALQRARAAHIKKTDVQEAQILLAGFVSGVPGVAVVDSDVRFPSAEDVAGGFVGLYAATAGAAWEAVRAFDEPRTLLDVPTMRTLLETLCVVIPELSGPVDVWTITPEGCDLNRGSR